MAADINAETDGKLKIAKARWGETFELKMPRRQPGVTRSTTRTRCGCAISASTAAGDRAQIKP
jgi:hypothetical protein